MSNPAGSSLGRLAGEFAAMLAQVVESMTDQKPESAWESASSLPADADPGGNGEPVWWEQRLQILPQPLIWVGAGRPVWEEIGALTLRAAGIESVETADARSTWLEIVGQAVGGVARATGAILGREVTCSQGAEGAPPVRFDRWTRVDLTIGGRMHAVWIALSPDLLEQVDIAGSEAASAQPADSGDGQALQPLPGGRTMDLLLNVELPVSISFGRTQIPLRDVLKLTTGSIVELNRGIGEPVEVLVNHSLIARGEVVVIDGNYGVKIQEIVRSEDRLRSIR